MCDRTGSQQERLERLQGMLRELGGLVLPQPARVELSPRPCRPDAASAGGEGWARERLALLRSLQSQAAGALAARKVRALCPDSCIAARPAACPAGCKGKPALLLCCLGLAGMPCRELRAHRCTIGMPKTVSIWLVFNRAVVVVQEDGGAQSERALSADASAAARFAGSAELAASPSSKSLTQPARRQRLSGSVDGGGSTGSSRRGGRPAAIRAAAAKAGQSSVGARESPLAQGIEERLRRLQLLQSQAAELLVP